MAVKRARLLQQGFEHDRRYMLLKVEADGGLTNVQIVNFPACARLFQDVEGDEIVVTHRPPEGEQRPSLRVPLRPDTAGLVTVEVRLFGSNTQAYRMGAAYDAWFSACLGFDAWLVYIGDGRRAVLAHSPRAGAPPPGSWRASLASLAAYVTPGSGAPEVPDWLTFNEAAPYLVATEASLRDVSARLPVGTSADMMRFRPVSNPPLFLWPPPLPAPPATFGSPGLRATRGRRKAIPGYLLLSWRDRTDAERCRTSLWTETWRGTKTFGRSCRLTAATNNKQLDWP